MHDRRNVSVSFIKINSDDLKDSKILVIGIEPQNKISDKTTSILKLQSSLIDESIAQMIENDSEFISKQDSFKETLKGMISREEVPSI